MEHHARAAGEGHVAPCTCSDTNPNPWGAHASDCPGSASSSTPDHPSDPERGADLSRCGLYRYRLWRRWDPARRVLVWLMLNPSTADADKDDATIRRVRGFTTAFGFGSFEVVNLFALRATDPYALGRAADPIGRFNDAAIVQAVTDREVVLAWGAHGQRHEERVEAVLRMLAQVTEPKRLHCLGRTSTRDPLHPLRLSVFTPLYPWSAP